MSFLGIALSAIILRELEILEMRGFLAAMFTYFVIFLVISSMPKRS